MPNKSIHKTFTAEPYAVFTVSKNADKTEKLSQVSLPKILSFLAKDIEFITNMVDWQLTNNNTLDFYLEYDGRITQCNTLGRILGFKLPKNMMVETFSGTKGFSRYEILFQDKLMREVKSWAERVKTTRGESKKFVSQGWKRTANNMKPDYLKPVYHLSAVDKQFAYIKNNPTIDGEIHLRLIVDGEWYEFRFYYDKIRFRGCSKITLPTVNVTSDGVVFSFTAEYTYIYRAFSERYIVGVDVGKTTYATAVVWDKNTDSIVHGYVMSRRATSLQNSITATEKQISFLHKKYGPQNSEIPLQRSSLSRKKRELDILVAQEIADIAETWGNAIIAVEDLSWIKNTMQNGRWNRGELVHWLTHYHELNGGRVIKVNAYKTSQECPYCHGSVTHPIWKETYCSVCDQRLDRDVAASAVIAYRAIPAVIKSISTRKKSKKYTNKKCRRTPKTKNTLSYPGRDRTKNRPTPKRIRQKIGVVSPTIVKNQCSAYHSDDGMVYADSGRYGTARTLKKQHDNDSTILLL